MSNVNRPLSGFRLVEVRWGDTLQAIAARELGDATRWRDLITVNGLEWPYLTGSQQIASDKVRLYGSQIAVPSTVTVADADIDPDEVFKVDIKLDKGRISADENGDMLLVSGRANYKQAIQNRVATDQGELIWHLPYGCGIRRLLGQMNGPTRAILAAKYVKSAVLADNRTQSVKSSSAEVVGDALVVQTEAVPINGAPVGVTQTFDL